uniref:Uncharacterized protein n=1 Tax=Panagrolaimus sp. ES5 TaxID=591445 RepID=A0AC34F1S7_9BILA
MININDSIISVSGIATTVNCKTSKYFPSDVLKWMKTNAKPQMSLKLMQVCKYFQHEKFPYFVVKKFFAYYYDIIYTPLKGNDFDYLHERNEPQFFGYIPNNLWLVNYLSITMYSEMNFIGRFIPKIAVCNVKTLEIEEQNLSIGEFKILAETVKKLLFKSTAVFDENNEIISLELFLGTLKNNIEQISIYSIIPSFSSTKATNEIFLPNLKSLGFYCIPNTFNYEAMFEFLEDHKTVEFELFFDDSLIFTQIQQLQVYVNNITSDRDLQYPPPYVTFTNQTIESKDNMDKLRKSFYDKLT